MKRCRKQYHRCRVAPSIEGLERRTLFSTLTLIGTNNTGIFTSGPPQPPDTAPPLYGMVPLRGNLLYVNDDGIHGSELYRSDGTQAGTVLVKDINPGPQSSAIGARKSGSVGRE